MSGQGDELLRAARTVVLPATAQAELEPNVEAFLQAGGGSVLLGETREEYVARQMSEARRQAESADSIRALTNSIRAVSGGPTIVAFDEEPGGIRRFAHLTRPLPSREALAEASPPELQRDAQRTGTTLRDLGLNLALGPVLDLTAGETPWLSDRGLGTDPERAADLGAAFIAGLQGAGVAATAKHFPGNRGLRTDPMLEADAPVPGDLEKLVVDLIPFAAAISAGVQCVMTGPATVAPLDRTKPSLLSTTTVTLLRRIMRFDGVVVSDDLDAASILAHGAIEEIAVTALAAGNDLLLVAASNDLEKLARAIAAAPADGRLDTSRLVQAAGRVRRLAARLHAGRL